MKGALIGIVIFWVVSFACSKYPAFGIFLVQMAAVIFLSVIAGLLGLMIQSIIKGVRG